MIKVRCHSIVGVKGKDVIDDISDPDCVPGFIVHIQYGSTLSRYILINGFLHDIIHVEHVLLEAPAPGTDFRLRVSERPWPMDDLTRKVASEEIERYCKDLSDS